MITGEDYQLIKNYFLGGSLHNRILWYQNTFTI